MLYRKLMDIEKRLTDVLGLIRAGKYSTPELANRLRVSIPTISRDVLALREQGHQIRVERHRGKFRYVLADTTKTSKQQFRLSDTLQVSAGAA